MTPAGFGRPPYPYDRLDAAARPWPTPTTGGVVDLSIGTPVRPAAAGGASRRWRRSGAERGYPPSIGTPPLREAAAGWMARRLGVDVDPSARRRLHRHQGARGRACRTGCGCARPTATPCCTRRCRYPTYEMGATLAGCRAGAGAGRRRAGGSTWPPSTPTDAARALCLWVNTPGNPAGGLDDLGAAAAWGRAHGVPVLSDECYVEFTWDGPRRTILEHGTDGVLAVHSLSKRSNLAGLRVGFYAGDPELVHYLSEVRKHAGFMVPGPVQAAAAVALDDDAHVDAQRGALPAPARAASREVLAGARRRRRRCPAAASTCGCRRPDGDAWALRRAPGRRRRRAWSARASSTARPAPATCASPWCSPTTASSWWPGASASDPGDRFRRTRCRPTR